MNNDVTNPRDANRILDESFLDVRAKLLEVAAVLDRVDRASMIRIRWTRIHKLAA